MRKLFFAVLLLQGNLAMGQSNVTGRFVDKLVQGYRVAMLIMTMNEGLNTFYPDKETFGKRIAYFPVCEGNEYKFVYYLSEPDFHAIATVYFDSTLNAGSARIDKNVRELTPFEYQTAVTQAMAIADLTNDTSIHEFPGSRQISIPSITAYGRSAYLFNWKSSGHDCHFGNDVEYTFGTLTDKIIGKRRIHQHLTHFSTIEAVPMHLHYGEDIDDIPVHDFASFFFFALVDGKEKYRIADDHQVIEVDIANQLVTRYTHVEYRKAGYVLPSPVAK